MFRSLGKMMGGSSSKKGKSKLQEDDSAADESLSADASPTSGRARSSSASHGASNNINRNRNRASSQSEEHKALASASGRSSPVKIEKSGGLSRHESPLPSPSASPEGVDGSDSNINGAESPTAGFDGHFPRNQAAQASASSPAGIPTTQTILANPAAGTSIPTSQSPNTRGYSGPVNNGVSNSASSSGAPGMIGSNSASGDQVRTFDIDDMIARLLDAGYQTSKLPKPALKNAEITAVCTAAREVFLSQPTLIELSPPVKIVGDTHGQYQDLLRLFEMCGFPPQSNYLFLGDYVDRGKQSLETILLLLCYKIKYPENFFLLRGNHECANVTRGRYKMLWSVTPLIVSLVYGFYDECKRRVNIKIWKTFIDVFNTLPIAAVVASKIFCVHGGLSPSLSNMDDIRRIERPTDVPDYGLLNDLLWSDPSDTALDWEDNERGVSYCFGKAVIQQFLAQYDFDLICRAHMVVEDGYEFWNERTLVTIFSAPNYCGGM